MQEPSFIMDDTRTEQVATKEEFVVDLFSALLQRVFIIGICIFFLKFGIDTFVLRRGGMEVINLAYIFAGSDNIGIRPPMISVGYPLLLSPLLLSFSPTVSVYLVQVVGLLSLVVCGRLLFQDEWLNRYWILGVPSFVLLSAMNTGESVFFLVCFAGLLALRGGKDLIGGVFLGIALFILPHQAALLIVSTLLALAWANKWGSSRIVLIVVACMAAGLMMVNKINFGGYFMNARAVPHGEYTRYVFSPPFKYILKGFLSGTEHLWKKIYVLANLAVVSGGLVAMYLRIRHEKVVLTDMVLWSWGCLSLLYAACYGSEWAFRSFPIIVLPAFPAVLLGFEKFLPKSWKAVLPLSLACIVLAVLAEAF
jgi:hypothetical protein